MGCPRKHMQTTATALQSIGQRACSLQCQQAFAFGIWQSHGRPSLQPSHCEGQETSMLLRNMALVGGKAAPVEMPPQLRPVFEEGVALAFGRWTALQLAVVNEWGGPSSREKAQSLLQEVIDWFYTKQDHDYLDLEDLLDDALQMDFSVQAEDDSPYQLSRNLVNMYNQVAGGDCSYVEKLRTLPSISAAGACQRDQARQEGEDGSSSSDDADDGQEGEDIEMDDAPAGEPIQPQQPLVDEDGFQVVQRKGRGVRR